MGVSDRKEREKEEMRAKILGASMHLFLTQGFEKTSIRNIAEAIEYSPSTIYLYFKDKSDLLFALHTQAFEGMMKHFLSVADFPDPFDKMMHLGQEYLKFAFDNPELYELMFLMEAPVENLNEEIWQDGLIMFSVLTGILTECQKAGRFKDHNIDDLAMMIWGHVHGLCAIHIKKRTLMFEECERVPKINRAFELFIKTIDKL